MSEKDPRVMSWGAIIAITMGTGLILGLLLGLLSGALGISSRWVGSAAGAAMGIVGVLLVVRRQQALTRRKAPDRQP